MSGHSRWAKLKHFKGAMDAKKSSIFTKVAHMITVAAKEGGGDPEANFKLRLAIDKARQVNMPKDNVERAISRGLGSTGEAQIEEAIYEAYLPGGAAIIIEALTDNKNRTLSSLRRIFNKYGMSLAGQNAVAWMFERRGVLRIVGAKQVPNFENLEMQIIEAGAEDIKEEENDLIVYTKAEDLQKIKETLEKQGVKFDDAQVERVGKNLVKLNESDQKRVETIQAELDEDPDINDYCSNIE